MKTVSPWDGLREFGIDLLTGEACSLMYRLLCDLTQSGKRIVERCLSVQIQSENWNGGSNDDPHVACIMLTQEMLVPLAVFALLETAAARSGSRTMPPSASNPTTATRRWNA